MGRLVPEDFALSSLADDAERRVVEAFRDGLTDGWLVLRDVGSGRIGTSSSTSC